MLTTQYPFTYRVAGIALHQGRVLIHRAVDEAFWTLPGGRVESNETAAEGLAREMQEEEQATIRVGRLRYVLESFFTYDGVSYHEIGFYFAMRFAADSWVLQQRGPFRGWEQHIELIYEWVPLDELPQRHALPAQLFTELPQARRGIRYLVHNDIGKYDH